jgi:predicted  nucleic acid-binding Zn-ribbon protein
MEFQTFDIINIVTPVATGVIGWLTGRRKQKNDFLNDLQASIDLLAEKNRLLMEEVIKLREENASLRGELTLLRKQLEKEVGRLKKINEQS